MTVLLTALILIAQSGGAQAPQRGRELVTYYCSGPATLPGQGQSVSVTKVFLEDGSVYNQSVEFYGEPAFVRAHAPNDRIAVTLKWPGEPRFPLGTQPFSWDDGSIRISPYPQAGFRPERGEVWQRTVIDRNGSVRVYEQDGVQMLLTTRMEPMLATSLDPPNGGWMTMSIGNLLAWGQGVERLTGYSLLVQRRRYRANSYPNDGIGRQRIVAQYEIETAGLARRVGEIREAVTAWESGLGDFHACRRQIEHPDAQIVVTVGRISRPGR